ISDKNEKAEADKARLGSPEYLDLGRLNLLLPDGNKELFNFITSFYEEAEESEEKDGKLIFIKKHRLIKSNNSMEMLQLARAFESIEYNTAHAAIKGK